MSEYNGWSLQLNKGRYYVAVKRLYDAESGKRKQKAVSLGLTTDATRKDVIAAFKDFVEKQGKTEVVYSRNILFTEWIDQEWFKYKDGRIDGTTYANYRYVFNAHIRPFFQERGTILQKLTFHEIQAYYDHCKDAGLNKATIAKHRTIIRGALDLAYRRELISNNPADRAEIPESGEEYRAKHLRAETAIRLLEAAKGKSIYPVVFIALHFGLRRSEIAGLTWSEIDMDRRMIHISKTKVSDGKRTYVKDKNKTKRSYRTIRMSEEAYEFFSWLRRMQAEDKLKHGQNYQDNDFVCKLPTGKSMSPSYMSHKINELSKETGIDIGLHGLRHTAASIMIAEGANMKQIQATMGHEQISTTFDTYGQLDFEDTIAPIEALSAALSVDRHVS